MKCPVCDATLRTVQKYNVEIDICPDCKGVWLDRGELEKVMQFAVSGGPVQNQQYQQAPVQQQPPIQQSSPYQQQMPQQQPAYQQPAPPQQDYNQHQNSSQQAPPQPNRPLRKGEYIDPRTGQIRRKEPWWEEMFDIFD